MKLRMTRRKISRRKILEHKKIKSSFFPLFSNISIISESAEDEAETRDGNLTGYSF